MPISHMHQLIAYANNMALNAIATHRHTHFPRPGMSLSMAGVWARPLQFGSDWMGFAIYSAHTERTTRIPFRYGIFHSFIIIFKFQQIPAFIRSLTRTNYTYNNICYLFVCCWCCWSISLWLGFIRSFRWAEHTRNFKAVSKENSKHTQM